MKTSLIFFTYLVVTSSFSFADEPEKLLTNNIRQHLSVPASMKKNKETVRVDFRINETGQAEILKVHSNDQYVRTDVTKQFINMKHDRNSYVPHTTYSIKVVFQVL